MIASFVTNIYFLFVSWDSIKFKNWEKNALYLLFYFCGIHIFSWDRWALLEPFMMTDQIELFPSSDDCRPLNSKLLLIHLIYNYFNKCLHSAALQEEDLHFLRSAAKVRQCLWPPATNKQTQHHWPANKYFKNRFSGCRLPTENPSQTGEEHSNSTHKVLSYCFHKEISLPDEWIELNIEGKMKDWDRKVMMKKRKKEPSKLERVKERREKKKWAREQGWGGDQS